MREKNKRDKGAGIQDTNCSVESRLAGMSIHTRFPELPEWSLCLLPASGLLAVVGQKLGQLGCLVFQ